MVKFKIIEGWNRGFHWGYGVKYKLPRQFFYRYYKERQPGHGTAPGYGIAVRSTYAEALSLCERIKERYERGERLKDHLGKVHKLKL